MEKWEGQIEGTEGEMDEDMIEKAYEQLVEKIQKVGR